MLNKGDHIAAFGASAAMPQPLDRRDGKAISPTTSRAWADKVAPDALKAMSAPCELGLDWNRSRDVDRAAHCILPGTTIQRCHVVLVSLVLSLMDHPTPCGDAGVQVQPIRLPCWS